MAGELGAADAERDVRGFALKCYTPQGNWDLVGNNTPVFFVLDPYKFSRLHSYSEAPSENELALAHRDAGLLVTLAREPAPVTMLMSDRGLPSSVRYMNGYGSHTYSLINAACESVWVKFHFLILGCPTQERLAGRERPCTGPVSISNCARFFSAESRWELRVGLAALQ